MSFLLAMQDLVDGLAKKFVAMVEPKVWKKMTTINKYHYCWPGRSPMAIHLLTARSALLAVVVMPSLGSGTKIRGSGCLD